MNNTNDRLYTPAPGGGDNILTIGENSAYPNILHIRAYGMYLNILDICAYRAYLNILHPPPHTHTHLTKF